MTPTLWLAVTSGFPMTFLMLTGLTMAPAAHGATIGPGTVTVIGIIGSVVLFGARLSAPLVVGIIGVICGLGFLAFAGSGGAGAETLRGDLCFLGVGLLWGFYPLLIQLWKVNGLRGAVIVSVLSLAYLPFYFLFFFRGFDIAPWWVLVLHAIYQGVVNVILGLWLWGWAAHVLGAAVVGRFPPLIPVTGTTLAIPALGVIGSLSCGGDYTGFKVFVYPPQTTSFRFPDDYDHIRVQLEMDNGKTYGETYEPVLTTQPPRCEHRRDRSQATGGGGQHEHDHLVDHRQQHAADGAEHCSGRGGRAGQRQRQQQPADRAAAQRPGQQPQAHRADRRPQRGHGDVAEREAHGGSRR